jgi:hypothetical protein
VDGYWDRLCLPVCCHSPYWYILRSGRMRLMGGVEEPGKDPRANESGSKVCGKIAQGASARAARYIHPIPAKQYDGVAPSILPTGADSSLKHADRGSVLKGRARGGMSYAEAARGKLPFQLP